MRATLLHGPKDIRLEQVPDPRIEQPTDALVTVIAACVCGSDLWPYRGVRPVRVASHKDPDEYARAATRHGRPVVPPLPGVRGKYG